VTRRLPHAELLSTPVRLPRDPAYPDTWTNRPDDTDDLLDALRDTLWPDDEWIDVEACPHLHLDPHVSYNVASGALRRMRRRARAELTRLRYGPALMCGGRPRIRRQARFRLLALWTIYRPCPCACGSWHVRPLLSWRNSR
jgi:hypothetical protein